MKNFILISLFIFLSTAANAQFSPWQCVSNGSAEFMSSSIDPEHYPKFCGKIHSKDQCVDAESIIGPGHRVKPCKWIDVTKVDSLASCVGIKKSNDKNCAKLGHDRASCEEGLLAPQFCRWHSVSPNVNQDSRYKIKESDSHKSDLNVEDSASER